MSTKIIEVLLLLLCLGFCGSFLGSLVGVAWNAQERHISFWDELKDSIKGLSR